MSEPGRRRLLAAGLVDSRTGVASLRLDPVPPAPGLARRFVADNLDGCPPDRRTVAVLVTSELVTNAVVHARTMVDLDVACVPGRVLLAVTDGEPAPPRRRGGWDEADAESGRGLHVVDTLADEVGTLEDPQGKTVWAVISLPN